MASYYLSWCSLEKNVHSAIVRCSVVISVKSRWLIVFRSFVPLLIFLLFLVVLSLLRFTLHVFCYLAQKHLQLLCF